MALSIPRAYLPLRLTRQGAAAPIDRSPSLQIEFCGSFDPAKTRMISRIPAKPHCLRACLSSPPACLLPPENPAALAVIGHAHGYKQRYIAHLATPNSASTRFRRDGDRDGNSRVLPNLDPRVDLPSNEIGDGARRSPTTPRYYPPPGAPARYLSYRSRAPPLNFHGDGNDQWAPGLNPQHDLPSCYPVL